MKRKSLFHFIIMDESHQRVGYGFSTKRYLEKVLLKVFQDGYRIEIIFYDNDLFKEQYCLVYD